MYEDDEEQYNGDKVIFAGCLTVVVFFGIIAALTLACICFSSCHTTKKSEQSSIRIESVETDITASAQAISQEEIFQRWAQSEWRNLDMHIRIFDTSKPVDSTMLMPPLLADIEVHSRDSTHTTEDTVDNINTTIQETTSCEASVTSVDIDKQKTETKISTRWRAYALIATILTGVLIYAWGQGWHKAILKKLPMI